MQVCNDKTVARQVCNTAPQEVCGLVQVPVTKFVDEEECANVNTRKCLPATRQECSDVVEQVGLITLLFSYTSLTSSLPRFPGRHSRLSATRSWWRTAPTLAPPALAPPATTEGWRSSARL